MGYARRLSVGILVLSGWVAAVRALPAFDSGERGGNQLGQFLANHEKEPPFFQKLVSSRIPSPDEAKNAALGHQVKGFGLRAYQAVCVIGLFRVDTIGGQGIPGFAAAGDWIWEVSIGPPGTVDDLIFIDARTAKIRTLSSQP